MLMPIALSFAEGCAQSPHRDRRTGVMEWCSDGFKTQYSNTPLLQHSILLARTSEIFLSSLQSRFFRTLTVRFHAALVLFFLVLAPGLSTAQSPPKVSVAYAAISPIFAGVWMAKEIGAFEKHGLKSELVYISSGS